MPNLPTVLQRLKPRKYLAFRSPSRIKNYFLLINSCSQTASIQRYTFVSTLNLPPHRQRLNSVERSTIDRKSQKARSTCYTSTRSSLSSARLSVESEPKCLKIYNMGSCFTARIYQKQAATCNNSLQYKYSTADRQLFPVARWQRLAE